MSHRVCQTNGPFASMLTDAASVGLYLLKGRRKKPHIVLAMYTKATYIHGSLRAAWSYRKHIKTSCHLGMWFVCLIQSGKNNLLGSILHVFAWLSVSTSYHSCTKCVACGLFVHFCACFQPVNLCNMLGSDRWCYPTGVVSYEQTCHSKIAPTKSMASTDSRIEIKMLPKYVFQKMYQLVDYVRYERSDNAYRVIQSQPRQSNFLADWTSSAPL